MYIGDTIARAIRAVKASKDEVMHDYCDIVNDYFRIEG